MTSLLLSNHGQMKSRNMIPVTRSRHILPKWFGKQPRKSVAHFKCVTGFLIPHSEQQNTMFASILPKGMSSESLLKMFRLDGGVDVTITLILSVILEISTVFVFAAVYSYRVASGMQMWSCSHIEFYAVIF